MKTGIKRIIYKIAPYPIFIAAGRLKTFFFTYFKSSDYKIIRNVDEKFVPIIEIKPETFEKVIIPTVYAINKECIMEVCSPAIRVYMLQDALISSGSDIIIVNDGVVWAKRFSRLYYKLTPDDPDLLSFRDSRICVKNKKYKRTISGNVISMLGQFDSIWSHFLMQFFPKLYYAAQNGLIDNNTTIIIPKYNDSNIIEAVESIIERYNIKKIVAEPNTEYQCERLVYFTPVIHYPDQATYLIPQEIVLPRESLMAIKNGLVHPLRKHIYPTREKVKLFLIRRSPVRNLVNWKEVEDYFSTLGFMLIDGKDYSLEQKADLFGRAEIIAGAFSSAFTNVIFAQNAKVLLFMNIARASDTFITALSTIGNCKILGVVGEDEYPSGVHSSYRISLDEIKKAYNEILNI